jgi:hypothetical protein
LAKHAEQAKLHSTSSMPNVMLGSKLVWHNRIFLVFILAKHAEQAKLHSTSSM